MSRTVSLALLLAFGLSCSKKKDVPSPDTTPDDGAEIDTAAPVDTGLEPVDTADTTPEDTDGSAGDDTDASDTADSDAADTDAGDTEDTDLVGEAPDNLPNACVDPAPTGGAFSGAREITLPAGIYDYLVTNAILKIDTEAQWDYFAAALDIETFVPGVTFETEQLVVASYTASSTCGLTKVHAKVIPFGFAAQPYLDFLLENDDRGCDLYAQKFVAFALPDTASPQVCVRTRPPRTTDPDTSPL